MSEFSAFAEMERRSWSDATRASGYVQLFASAPDQAIQSLLDAADASRDLKALDLCCGQGNVSQALLGRGCRVIGVDFSPAMLAFARQRAPTATFVEADAQDAMTVWCGPESSPCFASVYAAIKEHGDPGVCAPPGPDFHQFARRDVAIKLLSEARFSNIEVTTVDCAWNLSAPEDLFEIYAKGTVRAAMLLSKQPPDNLAAIRSALTTTVREKFSSGSRWRVPVPAALVRAIASR